MRALVIGEGMIGTALSENLRVAGWDVLATTRHKEKVGEGAIYLDLDREASFAISLPKIDVAFFCAAITKYKDCREHEEMARRVNATHPAAIAQQLVARGTRVILLSTSAVLDCLQPRMAASRPHAPASAYGRTKAAAESAFLALGEKAAILRLTKVLTDQTGNFPEWIRKLGRGESIECADDFRFAPIMLEHVIHAVIAITRQQEGGMFQVSTATDISYAEAARHVADRLQVSRHLVKGSPAAALKIDAEAVTAYTSLDSERLERMISFVPPDPRDVIDTVMAPVFADARNAKAIGAGT